jgi:hypothetical protein
MIRQSMKFERLRRSAAAARLAFSKASSLIEIVV